MPHSPLSSSEESPKRNVTDVYHDRGEEYPKKKRKEHAIASRADRLDYLVVAYSLMTRRLPDGLARILEKGKMDRTTVLMSFKSVGTQLSLWWIIKKVLSYDQTIDIVTPSVNDVETLLLEMQDLFAPVKKTIPRAPVVLPTESPVKKITDAPRTFMGRPIVSPYVLAILDWLEVEAPKEEQDQESIPAQPTTLLTPWVSAVSDGVRSKVVPLLPAKEQPPRFQRPILPASPRRGYGRQHVGNIKWEVPFHLRAENTPPVIIATPVETSESVQPKYDIPDFDDMHGALKWLHERTHWHDLYRHIEWKLRDDLAVIAYLSQQDGELRAGLMKIKWKFK